MKGNWRAELFVWWHYHLKRLWAYEVWHRSTIERFLRLNEQGARDYANRVLVENLIWMPRWRRKDGSLRWAKKK